VAGEVADARIGQLDRERGALALALAGGGDGAAVQIDELAHDGEAQTEAALGARTRRITLPEPVEDVREEGPGDPLARVPDGQARAVVEGLEADLDAPLRRGELDGVREQVREDLLDAGGVAHDGVGGAVDPRLELDAALHGARAGALDGGLDDAGELDGLVLDVELA